MPLVKDKTGQTYKPLLHRHSHLHEPGYSHHHESDHPESWNELLKGRSYRHEHPHENHTPDAHKTQESKTLSWESGTDDNSPANLVVEAPTAYELTMMPTWLLPSKDNECVPRISCTLEECTTVYPIGCPQDFTPATDFAQ